eukprot:337339-Pelagomonas_calceolata.AAC.1
MDPTSVYNTIKEIIPPELLATNVDMSTRYSRPERLSLRLNAKSMLGGAHVLEEQAFSPRFPF